MRLVFNIFSNYVGGDFISNTSDKIAIVPQLICPELFLNLGKFFKQLPTRYAFHYLYYFCWSIPRRCFQKYVHMVFCYFHGIYLKPIFLSNMIKYFFQVPRNIPGQYMLSILRYPLQVILQIVNGMLGSSYSHAIFIPSGELFGKHFTIQSLDHFHPASKLTGIQWNFL